MLTTIYDKMDKKSERMLGFEPQETGKISHQMKETARRFIEKGNYFPYLYRVFSKD